MKIKIATMKTKISDLISAHSANMGTLKAVSDGNFVASGTGGSANSAPGICLTAASMSPEPWEPVGYSSGTPSSTESVDFSEFKVALADFRTKLQLRITEISNRIGYLNSKDVADGGTDTGSTNKSVSGTNLGFQGYVFPTGTTGRGYANTVYSHANFLAGKKINLFGKVLKAIVGVQAMYDSVTTKRSEYYEYNQAS